MELLAVAWRIALALHILVMPTSSQHANAWVVPANKRHAWQAPRFRFSRLAGFGTRELWKHVTPGRTGC